MINLLLILQITFDTKIPVWGIIIYIGLTIWFFISQYFKVIDHTKRIETAENKIVSIEKDLVTKVDSLKLEMNTKIDNLSKTINDLEKSIVKLSTVIEMKLLSEMKQSKKDSVTSES